MTPRIIYHDFRQTDHPQSDPESTVVLTARVLTKGRRWHKFWDNFNTGLTTICLTICGIGFAVSIYVLSVLL